MRHTRPPRAILAAALAVLAACTGDRPDPAPGDIPPGASAFRAEPDSSSQLAQAAAADTLARAGELVFAIHPDVPRFGFTPTLGEDGAVARIDVRPLGARAPTQTLEVPDNLVGGDDMATRLFVGDINFDGHADLQFVTDRGAANTISAYWVFGPGDRRFHFVDELPTVQVDSAARELTSYHNGGNAGRIFSASRFRWEGRRLVETRREQQDVVSGTTDYVYTVETLQRGQLVETARETRVEDEAFTGPSWWDDGSEESS